jgi:hypothetical protein
MKPLAFASLVLLAGTLLAQTAPVENTRASVHNAFKSSLEAGFKEPPSSAHPWVWWMWMGTENDPAAITKDLEEMHAKGIEGAILFQTGPGPGLEASARMVPGNKEFVRTSTDDFDGAHMAPLPQAAMPAWGPEARERIRFAVKEAARLQVKLGITVGLADTSGSIAEQYGMQRLVWSETDVSGSTVFNQVLAEPLQAYYSELRPQRSYSGLDPAPTPGKYRPVEIAVLAVPDKPSVDVSEVIDLSDKLRDDNLQWIVPAGKWKVFRFAYEPTGRQSLWGLFTDAMSPEALDETWRVTMGNLLEEMSPQERRQLCCVLDDSWEAGQPTWTKLFPTDFAQRRGYDLIRWLPVFAGEPEGTDAQRAGVKRDFDRTVADLVAESHYAHLTELAHRAGMVAYAEAAGPNTAQFDPILNGKDLDFSMGEFWMPSEHRPTPDLRFLIRDSATASHIYGKRITACESFTSVGPQWEESLFDMKNVADQAFSDGCNRIFIHAYSQSPSATAKPGYVYFAGTHYDRHVTWWDETPAFNEYLGRVTFMLQQGLFVADALYFKGDGIGQIEQRKTQPSLPAEGYDHDNIDLDGLMSRVAVKDGRIVLPDGMSYRMLVLPKGSAMPIEALRKIHTLVDQGAVVVGPRPQGLEGLARSEADQKEYESLTSHLWRENDVPNHGSSRVVLQSTPVEVLKQLHIPPDVKFEGLSDRGEIDWIHRRVGTTEVYFVSSRWDPEEKISATFRVSGMQPELWNPVTGEIKDAKAFRQEGELTTIPLKFDPRGSVFVIFRRSIPKTVNGGRTTNYPTMHLLQQLSGEWKVSFKMSARKPEAVTFDSLADWTTRSEEGIRHYSGDAIYRKAFMLSTLPPHGQRVFLDLGEVHEVARVKLNGIDLGVLWTKPARVDISSVARAGRNELQITVTNLWPNRMIGDQCLPPNQRITETNADKFNCKTPLYQSGLIGPVKLELIKP